MCVVSFVGKHYEDEFSKKPYRPWEAPTVPGWPPTYYPKPSDEEVKRQIEKLQNGVVSNEEIKKQVEELRKQVEEMKKFLIEALEYDRLYKQPDCENDLKIAFLKKVAESVGLTLDDIFPNKPTPPPSRLIKEHQTPKKKK